MAKLVARQPTRDFSGAIRTEIERGDLVVKRLACRVGSEKLLATALRRTIVDNERLWVRIWQEHVSARKVVDELGGKWVCTKVLSGSELVGIWCVGNPAAISALPHSESWTLRRLSVAPLSVDRARAALWKRYSDFVTHYSTKYNSFDSWSAFSLRSYGGESNFIMKPTEMTKEWKRRNQGKLLWKLRNTVARKALFEFETLIQAVPGIKHRIRIMRLAAGGSVGRHSDIVDRETGTTEGKTLRIHVPISTNAQVQFTSWDLFGKQQTAHMKEGEVWYVDTRKPHQVDNGGNTDRLHLVMDVLSCPELISLLDGSKTAPGKTST